MSDPNNEGIIQQIIRKLAGTLGFVLCAAGVLGFLVAGFAIDYIDERLEEDCEGVKGTIIQTVGVDEGQWLYVVAENGIIIAKFQGYASLEQIEEYIIR